MQGGVIRDRVRSQLGEAGWNPEDILEEQSISQNGNRFRIDVVLLYNLYPLAAIEIKNSLAALSDATSQIIRNAEAINVPFAFATDGNKIIDVKLDGTYKMQDKFPTPSELLLLLGREWTDKDPRLFPPFHDFNVKPRLHHVQAISRCVESIINGDKRALVSLTPGSGSAYVSFQIAWKLIQSGYCKRMLFLSSRREIVKYMAKIFEPFNENLCILDGEEIPKIGTVHLDTIQHMIQPRQTPKFEEIPADFYDMILIYDLNNISFSKILFDYFERSVLIAVATRQKYFDKDAVEIFGQPIFTYSFESAIANEPIIEVPEGFKSIQLDEIAEIQNGLRTDRRKTSEIKGTLLVASRDIQNDGNIDWSNIYKYELESIGKKVIPTLEAKDILISTFSSGNTIKLGFVSNDFSNHATFSNSLILIRVNPGHANPEDVFEFLRSDVGQMILRREAINAGATISRISVRNLGKILVLLPKKESNKKGITTELSTLSSAKHQITNDILPLLEKLEQNEPNQNEGENQEIELIAMKLKQLASNLCPPKLSDQLMFDYPTPIALAYKRFHDARFNVYERVLRLRDVFEAASYYIYNIVLADALQRLDPKKYYIKDNGARRAFNGYSLSSRMDLVGEILEISKFEKGQDLFIPELIDSSFVDQAKQLQSDFRNKLSHTATATESQQKKVLSEFEPIVEKMLFDLQFLVNYRLVRITSFYYKNHNLIRRMEVYHGIVPDIEEDELLDEIEFINSDRDHIILLNSDGQILDLHPLYQLIASEETRHENHMCFFKQRKSKEHQLDGESVQGAFPITLEGFDYFESLQLRILSSAPED